jgi:hypothetical protein
MNWHGASSRLTHSERPRPVLLVRAGAEASGKHALGVGIVGGIGAVAWPEGGKQDALGIEVSACIGAFALGFRRDEAAPKVSDKIGVGF